MKPAFIARLCMVAILCAPPACRKETSPKVELTVDRFGRTAEPGPVREALTLQEVSFMVRMREADAQILDQVARRGLADPIDENAVAGLAAQGASPRMIEQLKTSPHVLTPAERALYARREEMRKTATETARTSDDWLIRRQRVELNERIRTAERARLEERLKQEQAKVWELQQKLSGERYSRSSVSPYQGVARELEQARERANQTSTELGKL